MPDSECRRRAPLLIQKRGSCLRAQERSLPEPRPKSMDPRSLKELLEKVKEGAVSPEEAAVPPRHPPLRGPGLRQGGPPPGPAPGLPRDGLRGRARRRSRSRPSSSGSPPGASGCWSPGRRADVHRRVAAVRPEARFHAEARCLTVETTPAPALPGPDRGLRGRARPTCRWPRRPPSPRPSTARPSSASTTWASPACTASSTGPRRSGRPTWSWSWPAWREPSPRSWPGSSTRRSWRCPRASATGPSFHGLAALLAMLNSCASGVGVVNIDNGFGAAHLACLILRGNRPPRSLTKPLILLIL